MKGRLRRAEVRRKKTAALHAAAVGDEELQVQLVLGRGVDFYSLAHWLTHKWLSCHNFQTQG